MERFLRSDWRSGDVGCLANGDARATPPSRVYLYPAGDYADPEERVRSWLHPPPCGTSTRSAGVSSPEYALSHVRQLIMRGSGTPIRRAQLVSPFGVGAMVTGPDGISVMTAGLDAWFRREGGEEDSANLDPTEFRARRVAARALSQGPGVPASTRLPPISHAHKGAAPNTGLTVPMVRFPQIHFCRNGK